MKSWNKRHPAQRKLIKAKSFAKSRGLGFNIKYKNKIAEPVVYHHLNKSDVIAIPEDIHQLYFGNEFKTVAHRFMVKQVVKQIYKKVR